MATIRLLIPEAPSPAGNTLGVRRRVAGRNIRLGTLDNAKGNGDHLLAMLVDGLKATLPIASVVALSKPHPSLPAAAETLDRLAAEADFVLTAMAD